MPLVDALDGVLMLGAYGWAFAEPIRKLYYNMAITLVSVVVAVAVGGIEALGLAADKLHLTGVFWSDVGAAVDDFGALGYVIVGLFALGRGIALARCKCSGYDERKLES